jgi:hypothetical protein
MTKGEREIVAWAVRELMKDDGNFHAAVGRLAHLCGMQLRAYEVLGGKDIRTLDYSQFHALPEGGFKVKP